jgi:hypothetical protein
MAETRGNFKLCCYIEAKFLLSRDVNSPKLCFVNKEAECDAVRYLTSHYLQI